MPGVHSFSQQQQQQQHQAQPPYSTATPAAMTVPAQAVVDDTAMLSAQKHARWAISALNFEDVPTAVRELRAALKDLGG